MAAVGNRLSPLKTSPSYPTTATSNFSKHCCQLRTVIQSYIRTYPPRQDILSLPPLYSIFFFKSISPNVVHSAVAASTLNRPTPNQPLKRYLWHLKCQKVYCLIIFYENRDNFVQPVNYLANRKSWNFCS